jgi:ankyrin repeat protein
MASVRSRNDILEEKIRYTIHARKLQESQRSVATKAQQVIAWASRACRWPAPALEFACGALDVEKAVRLLDDGNAINHDFGDGRTPLIATIKATPYRVGPQTAMIEFLLAEGADINYSGNGKMTPLCTAMEQGRIELVHLLLNLGANVHAHETSFTDWHPYYGCKESPLHVAAGLNNIELVQLLLDWGARASTTFDLYRGERLSSRNIKLKSADDRGWIRNVNALHLTNLTCAKRLIEYGADMMTKDSRGRTPFHWAAEFGDLDAVLFYISQGYPVNDRDCDGATALALICAAIERGEYRNAHKDITKAILEAGGDLDIAYPQHLTIRQRWWMMEEWRETYGSMFGQPDFGVQDTAWDVIEKSEIEN